jgi:hypothetical protein
MFYNFGLRALFCASQLTTEYASLVNWTRLFRFDFLRALLEMLWPRSHQEFKMWWGSQKLASCNWRAVPQRSARERWTEGVRIFRKVAPANLISIRHHVKMYLDIHIRINIWIGGRTQKI